MISISSDELNYIVFRYLHESGFTHSAFAFGYEAGINKSAINGDLVPPGALVTFVQKGLQYLELEANLGSSDADVDDDFSFIQPLDLITKDAYELQRIVKEKKESFQKDKSETNEKENETKQKNEPVKAQEREEKEKEKKEMEQEENHDKEMISKDPDEDKEKAEVDPHGAVKPEQVELEENNGDRDGPEPMEISTTPTSVHCEFSISDVTILEGHTSEVFVCAWSPSGSLIASGSGDATARIWSVKDEALKSAMQNGLANSVVLRHYKGRTNDKSKDVTTLDWNGDGTLLATGSYDGQARIWSRDGELRSALNKHRGPIFSLKWNKKGDYLLSSSVDNTAIVWDPKTEECKQLFEFHSAPVLDVDWRNNLSFATCSTDTRIHICKVGEKLPVKTFSGHQDEVNAIKWDPTGTLLASCSDDSTAKIWSMKQDKCLHDLRKHTMEIYTIRWSPTGTGTNNPNLPLLLASASFDSTVKLWDVEQGLLLYSFNGHRDPVYSVAFSPNCEYLASGSMDKCMHIWSLKEGKIVKTYSGEGGIFEVCWNKEGNKIAACFGSNVICIMDFRM